MKALAEDKLARVQDTLMVTEEAKRKAKLRLPAWRLNELHSCWRLGRLRMKCFLSILKRTRTKRPCRRTTIRP